MVSARGVFIGGDDFKSGQTKIKSVLVDFLVSSGTDCHTHSQGGCRSADWVMVMMSTRNQTGGHRVV